MKISGDYIYKSAIIITSDRMKELVNILEDYYPHLEYESTLVNESSIEFSNLEEMLNYDNASKQKIHEIKIFGVNREKNTRAHIFIRSIDSPFNNFHKTVTVIYELSKHEDETVLRSKLKQFFDKTKAPNSLIYKFTFYQLFALLSGISIGITITEFATTKANKQIIISWNLVTIVMFIVSIYLLFVLNFPKLWRKWFPPIVFSWGEEIEINKRLCKNRSNIFWGLFVALIIGGFFFILSLLI